MFFGVSGLFCYVDLLTYIIIIYCHPVKFSFAVFLLEWRRSFLIPFLFIDIFLFIAIRH